MVRASICLGNGLMTFSCVSLGNIPENSVTQAPKLAVQTTTHQLLRSLTDDVGKKTTT